MPKTFAKKVFFFWMLWFRIQLANGKVNITKRIWNGWISKPNAYPFMVSIWDAYAGYICGGALISFQHALTAGHCVDIPNAIDIIDMRVGLYRLSDPLYFKTKLQKITLYPLYKRGHIVDEYDFAIVKAPVPFKPHIRIKPIMFNPNSDAYPLAGKVLKMTGWGKKNLHDYTDREPLSESKTMLLSILDVLLEGEFNVISLQKCHAKMFRIMNVTKAYICTEQAYFAVCAKDSGSPLFHITKGVAYLDGISIIGNTNCKDDRLGNLAVFANVNFFKTWIKANM